MRRYEQQRNAETRSIQTGVQLLLIAIGVLFLVSGLVIAASGSSIGTAIGSFAEDSSADGSSPEDTETEKTADGDERVDGSDAEESADAEAEAEADESDTADGTDRDERDEANADDDGDADDETHTHNLTVLVEDDDGDPVENATVELADGPESDREEATDEDGEASFAVEDGEYTVSAEADGHDRDEVDVEIDGEDETLLLDLGGEYE